VHRILAEFVQGVAGGQGNPDASARATFTRVSSWADRPEVTRMLRDRGQRFAEFSID
jgi:hypothetical protein